MALLKNEQRMHWYVMRDLKRPNAKLPAYKQLSDEHLEVFTPMQWRLKLKNGKRIREEVPFYAGPAFYPRYKRSSRSVCS